MMKKIFADILTIILMIFSLCGCKKTRSERNVLFKDKCSISMYTTINSQIQSKTEHLVDKLENGSIIVVDNNNGNILAYSQSNQYDFNFYGKPFFVDLGLCSKPFKSVLALNDYTDVEEKSLILSNLVNTEYRYIFGQANNSTTVLKEFNYYESAENFFYLNKVVKINDIEYFNAAETDGNSSIYQFLLDSDPGKDNALILVEAFSSLANGNCQYQLNISKKYKIGAIDFTNKPIIINAFDEQTKKSIKLVKDSLGLLAKKYGIEDEESIAIATNSEDNIYCHYLACSNNDITVVIYENTINFDLDVAAGIVNDVLNISQIPEFDETIPNKIPIRKFNDISKQRYYEFKGIDASKISNDKIANTDDFFKTIK